MARLLGFRVGAGGVLGKQVSMMKEASPSNLVEAFRAVVRRYADKVALVFPPAGADTSERRVSYRQLDAWSDAIGQQLRAAGLRPGGTVAIYMHRSPESVAGIIAVLKAGGTYVPMDPDHPAKRIRFMADDCEIRTALIRYDKAERHSSLVAECGMAPVVINPVAPVSADSGGIHAIRAATRP